MSQSPIRHIFFDLDHTLWDFESNSRSVLMRLVEQHKVLVKCGTTLDSWIKVYEMVNADLWRRLRENRLSKEDLRALRFSTTMAYFGYEDADLSHALEQAYISSSPYEKKLFPGTMDMLRSFSSRCDLHIITNGFKEVQYIKLENTGMKPFFKQVVISEEVGIYKPDPEIFIRAMAMAGALPEESLMVGDDLGNDVLPALQSGMKALWFNPKQLAASSSHAGHTLHHWDDLERLWNDI